MPGTSASMIVHNQHHLDGEVINIPQTGFYNKIFTSPISHVSLHNMTHDILQVEVFSTSPVSGNSLAMIAPGSAINFGDLPLGYITSLLVTDTNILGNGGGNFILNTHYN